MNRENMIAEIRGDLTEIISQITPENYVESFKKMKRYKILLRWLSEFSEEFTEEVKEDSEEKSVIKTITEVCDKDNNIYIGQFERKLLGGEFGSFAIFVPEKTVRDLEIQEGDWIKGRVNHSYRTLDGNLRYNYDFEIIQRNDGEIPSDRKEIKFAIVEWENDLKEYYITDPEEKGLKTKILLSKYYVDYFHIAEGDIVDYAYYDGNKLNGRVIWKYPIEQEQRETPKPGSFYKKDNDSDSDDEKIVDALPEGTIIAVVGYESMKNVFEKVVDERGGEFIFFSGDESPASIEAQMKNASKIVLFPDYVSHKAMFAVKDIAKTYEIPISYPKRIGKSGFIRILENWQEEFDDSEVSDDIEEDDYSYAESYSYEEE